MIINLRGTGGSGKSTVVTRVMECYTHKVPATQPDRKRPVAYTLMRGAMNEYPQLRVLGHYETACGGCDTLKTVNQVYELIEEAVHCNSPGRLSYHVLYEGIIVADDVTRAAALSKLVGKENFRVILLTTPVEECLAAIRARRAVKGNTKSLSPTNTETRAKSHHRICERLEREGVLVERLDREAAFARCCELLGVS